MNFAAKNSVLCYINSNINTYCYKSLFFFILFMQKSTFLVYICSIPNFPNFFLTLWNFFIFKSLVCLQLFVCIYMSSIVTDVLLIFSAATINENWTLIYKVTQNFHLNLHLWYQKIRVFLHYQKHKYYPFVLTENLTQIVYTYTNNLNIQLCFYV